MRDIGVNHEVIGISEIEPDAIIAYGSMRYNLDELYTDKTHDEMKKELMAKNVGWDFQKQKSKIPRMKKDKLEMLYKFDKASNNFGDISIINPNELPDFDYFTYSFPCTDISVSGKMEGIEKGKTRSGLLYECEKIIETKKPKYLLMENVKNLVSKKFINDFNLWLEYLESRGYKNYWKVLNAKDFGIAQNRERVFCVSILGDEEYEFPKGFKLEKRLKDFLEDDIEEKYYLSEDIQSRFKQTKKDNGENNVIGTTAPEFRTIGQRDLVYGKDGVMGSLVATDYKQPKQIIDYEDKININEKENFTYNPSGENVIGEMGGDLWDKRHEQSRRVYDIETVSPTIPVCNGGGIHPKILDYADRLGGCFDDEKGKHQAGSVWNKDGLSPTIDTCQGGYRMPLVVSEEIKIEKVGNLECEGWYEIETRVHSTNGLAPTVETRNRAKYLEDVEHNTICEQRCDEGLRFFKDDVCGTIRTINSGGDKRVIEKEPRFRIRKLTPRECLRLMGLSDNDISKIQSTGLSDSSLYKLAGNSIVKQCLDYLHINMFTDNIDKSQTPSEE